MSISGRTRLNWVLDTAVFITAVLAALSSIYFLIFPSGGFQGGRNPGFGATVIFDRHTWSDLHTWASVAFTILIMIHLAYHWSWIKSMAKKIFKFFSAQESGLSRGGKVNLLVNVVIGASFLLTAISGIYFLFTPTGGFQGGANTGWDPGFLFSRITWGLLHTWSAVILILAAVFHFVIHWRWIRNVTYRFFATLLPTPATRSPLVQEGM